MFEKMQKYMKSKAGQLGSFQSLVIGLVVIGLVLVIGFSIMGKTKDTLTANSAEKNAATAVVNAMSDVVDWLPVVVIAVIGIAVLGIILYINKKQ